MQLDVNPPPADFEGIEFPLSIMDVVKCDLYGWFGIAHVYSQGGCIEGFANLPAMLKHHGDQGFWTIRIGTESANFYLGHGHPVIFTDKAKALRFLLDVTEQRRAVD